MARVFAMLMLVAASMVPSAQAGHVVLLVDSHRLLDLDVRAFYLLPDGRVIDHDAMIRACRSLRAAGWFVYESDSDVCRQEDDVLPFFRPPVLPQSTGIVVFDVISRQHCTPGACHMLVGAAPADAVFADRFELTP